MKRLGHKLLTIIVRLATPIIVSTCDPGSLAFRHRCAFRASHGSKAVCFLSRTNAKVPREWDFYIGERRFITSNYYCRYPLIVVCSDYESIVNLRKNRAI
jgi:hypothetical protein